jgi:glucose-1-phosphate cytidylyltransferase
MKAVILAGGLGTRMREETEFRPKPMVEIGGKPILWHIMKIFADQGVTEFVILAGYKGEMIKRYFHDYSILNRDFTVHIGDHPEVEYYGSHEEDGWKVTVVETGQLSLTGERILRARSHIGDQPFFLTYGDGLANVDLAKLLEIHTKTEAALTISTSRPQSRFGIVSMSDDGRVVGFAEKPQGQEFVNIGYMVANESIFSYLEPGGSLEGEPLASLVKDKLLSAHHHRGFWQPMDTQRELKLLADLWEKGAAPWTQII